MTGIKNISINPPKTSIKMDEISNALRSLKMPGMAHYWTAMQETRQHDSLSLKDGLQLLIQAELDNRILSRNARLVKNARFRYKASIGEVIYDSKRRRCSTSPHATMCERGCRYSSQERPAQERAGSARPSATRRA